MFEKITKGEFNQGLCNTYNQDGLCVATSRNEGNLIEDAEFITYCFNLQQNYNIGMMEEAVKTLASLLEELYSCSLPTSMNYEIEQSEKLLSKIKKP